MVGIAHPSNKGGTDNLSRSTSGRLAISMEDKFDDVMLGDHSDADDLYDSPSDDDTITVDITPSRVKKIISQSKAQLEANTNASRQQQQPSEDVFSDDDNDNAFGDKRTFTKGANTITPRTKKALDQLELTKALKEDVDDEYVIAEKNASKHIDSLEQSMSQLENWLEDKV